MNGNWKLWALGATIVAQLLVLAGELIGAAYPLWIGQEVRLQVEPVDPRSLFRGNYARLEYEIGTVKQCDKEVAQELRKGEVVYVSLVADADGIMHAQGFSLDRPEAGSYIRGRIEWVQHDCPEVNVRYGIEAYFLPRDKALAMEDKLRQGEAVAKVMLAPGGKAALVEVLPGAQSN